MAHIVAVRAHASLAVEAVECFAHLMLDTEASLLLCARLGCNLLENSIADVVFLVDACLASWAFHDLKLLFARFAQE